MSHGNQDVPNGVPAPEAPQDPIERLRTYILQKLLRGEPRTAIEDELIAKGYEIQYAIQIVDSVKRSAERRAGPAELLLEGDLPELPAPVYFDEAQQQLETMAVFTVPPGTPRPKPRSDLARRLFLVLSIIGLVLLGGGLLSEARFWFVWLSGARSAGVVTLVEDRIVLRPFTQRTRRRGEGLQPQGHLSRVHVFHAGGARNGTRLARQHVEGLGSRYADRRHVLAFGREYEPAVVAAVPGRSRHDVVHGAVRRRHRRGAAGRGHHRATVGKVRRVSDSGAGCRRCR